ncbi:MAG: molybdopterin biosynthesis protein [Deltaproteobacteria bacterium]|nr:molybdopterin biosynthesis protein [Deltaproteobacteria bacterium]
MEKQLKRQVYLSMKGLDEARELFLTRIGTDRRTAPEALFVRDALGRVTSEPVFARRSSPSYHAAAMDGIAVRAEETYGVTERRPKNLRLETDAVWVNTGQVLPEGFDAVIMVEKLHQPDDRHLEIRAPAFPWQHVRKVGEDIVATEMLLPQNHRVRPYDMGAMISAGVFSLNVWRRPRVAIIPTGSELVRHDDVKDAEPIEDGRIIEYNSIVLAALVRTCDAVPDVYDIVPDKEPDIRGALERAVSSDADVIIVNAGSSAGSRDYTVHMIGEMGEILVHGVAMMPGKPTILGLVRGKPVVGNPGYTVSSTLSFEQFVQPLLYRLQGMQSPVRPSVRVHPTRDIPSKLGIEEFLRVNIGKVGDNYVATPLPRAAGSVTTLTRAEGIVRIPALSEGIVRGEQVEAALLVPEKDLLNTVVIIGSHDITLDILANEIRAHGAIRVSSGNVGSLGGLLALRKGTCHMAGSHLLDTATGEYNLSYIGKYLKGLPVSVFHLVLRDQGLIVGKGNPKGIRGIGDLARKDVTFVNRQAGSGTRVLLDYHLETAGIRREDVAGYDHDEYTHMAVAVDVLSGAADCGMGIFAAAKALNLDFVSVAQEQYDLIVPTELVGRDKVAAALETVRSERFRSRVLSLGGYDPAKSGQLWTEIEG